MSLTTHWNVPRERDRHYGRNTGEALRENPFAAVQYIFSIMAVTLTII
jgi:hypothetical protein